MVLIFSYFHSIDKVSRIQSPVLIIHGKEDEVVDVNHGYVIVNRIIKCTVLYSAIL